MGIKRHIANLLERLSGNFIIPPGELHLMHEQVHLRRFFEYFDVDCVFDVGANAGQYATTLREKVGFRGDIISFEPIPELAEELRVRAASDSRWHIEQLALDREAGPSSFNVMANSVFSSLHRPNSHQPEIFASSNNVVRSIPVSRSTIAIEFAKYRSRLGFHRPYLKIDTQGNDFAVVEGAGEALSEFTGLQSELAIEKLYDGSTDFADSIAAYVSRGFVLSAFVPNNEGFFPRLIEIDCIMVRRDLAKIVRERPK